MSFPLLQLQSSLVSSTPIPEDCRTGGGEEGARREREGSEGDGKHEETGVKKAKKPRILLPKRMNYSADDISKMLFSQLPSNRDLLALMSSIRSEQMIV